MTGVRVDDLLGFGAVGGSLVGAIFLGVQRLSKDVRHGFKRIEEKISREFARQREQERDRKLNAILASRADELEPADGAL